MQTPYKQAAMRDEKQIKQVCLFFKLSLHNEMVDKVKVLTRVFPQLGDIRKPFASTHSSLCLGSSAV